MHCKSSFAFFSEAELNADAEELAVDGLGREAVVVHTVGDIVGLADAFDSGGLDGNLVEFDVAELEEKSHARDGPVGDCGLHLPLHLDVDVELCLEFRADTTRRLDEPPFFAARDVAVGCSASREVVLDSGVVLGRKGTS